MRIQFAQIFAAVLILFGVIGLFSYNSYNFAPAQVMAETLVVVVSIYALATSRLGTLELTIMLCAGMYLLLNAVLAVYIRHVNLQDFMQANKSIYYLILLAPVANAKIFNRKNVLLLMQILLFLAFIKYTYPRFLGFNERLSTRPGIFVENNFELVFFIGLMILSHPFIPGRKYMIFSVLVAILIVLSGSRSAAVGYAAGQAAIFLRPSRPALSVVLGSMGVALTYAIFSLRGQSLSQVDRVQFFELFLKEMGRWPITTWVTGTPRMSPLSHSTCLQLNWLEDLYSRGGGTQCYSVILHSYVMRAIYDHGLVVLGLLLAGYFALLRNTPYSLRERAAIFLVIVASGFSVSAFNDPFSILLLMIAVSTVKPRTGRRMPMPPRVRAANGRIPVPPVDHQYKQGGRVG